MKQEKNFIECGFFKMNCFEIAFINKKPFLSIVDTARKHNQDPFSCIYSRDPEYHQQKYMLKCSAKLFPQNTYNRSFYQNIPMKRVDEQLRKIIFHAVFLL
jgi:hypothetical protein